MLTCAKLPEYFKKFGYKNPESLTSNSYMYAHETNGLTIWRYLSLDPEKLKEVNSLMEMETVQMKQSCVLFPSAETFARVVTNDETVLVVDVGGRNGLALAAGKELCPRTKGRLVFQDRREVIAGLGESLPGIEKIAMISSLLNL
jgi:hypothetical protein